MIIASYFKWDQSRTRLLSTPAGPYLSSLAEELEGQGFSYWILRARLKGAAHFSAWNQRQGRAIEQPHENALGAFKSHLRVCRCRRPLRASRQHDVKTLAGARMLIEHLRSRGVVTSAPPWTKVADPPLLFLSFSDWMRSQRGTKENTLHGYAAIIKDALEALGTDPTCYRPESIRSFILTRTHGVSRAKAKELVSAMRMFLRYLIAEGKCRPGMDDAVPTLAMWRLSALPRYLAPADVDRVIAACDRSTAVGLRDRAAILLLARLGLRAGDVLKMDLKDIDWTHASVRVSGKSRREVKLPLTKEMGEAVWEYLKSGRPPFRRRVSSSACSPPGDPCRSAPYRPS